jgi:hypothetical protein
MQTPHRRISALEKILAPPVSIAGAGTFVIYDPETGETLHQSPLPDGVHFRAPDNGRGPFSKDRSVDGKHQAE